MNHRRRLGITLVGLAGLTAPAALLAGTAHAAPPRTIHTSCTGQHVQQTAPYSCGTTKVILGVTLVETLSETAAGNLHVTVRTAAPAPFRINLHMTSHQGPSGAGLAQEDPDAHIAAGSTGPAELNIAAALCGQIDVKAIFTAPGDERGRLSGAYVNNDRCKKHPPTTTTTTLVPIPSLPSTSTSQVPSTPGHEHPGRPGTPPAVSIPQRPAGGGSTSTAGFGPIPATGAETGATAAAAAALLGLGLVLRSVSRRRAVR